MQACAEITHLFFKPYNYGIMRSRLERNYTLHTEIAWNVFIRITHDSKVVERISMRINTYKYVQLLSFKSNNYVPIPALWMRINMFLERIYTHLYVFIHIYTYLYIFICICRHVKVYNAKEQFCNVLVKNNNGILTIMAFWPKLYKIAKQNL